LLLSVEVVTPLLMLAPPLEDPTAADTAAAVEDAPLAVLLASPPLELLAPLLLLLPALASLQTVSVRDVLRTPGLTPSCARP
jgi:hypothetical protein